MKKQIGILIGVIFGFSFVCAEAETQYYGNSYARLSYVNGDVFIQRAEDLGYEEGVVNLALIEGDKLGSREGRAEIHLGNRNYLRLDSGTQLDLVEMPRQGYDHVKFHLLSGRIFLRVNQLSQEKEIEIHTPDASFYVLEEGLYALEVRENFETVLQVWEGSIEAAGESGSLLVNSSETLSAVNGDFLSEPGNFSVGFEDGFSEWNRGRDTFYNRRVTRTYLPPELNSYESELDYYGRWVYERPYGYVWIPRVYHSSWRPYWNGRWVWYPIIGWNWVSYEPWGWCVTHYGRWHWRNSLGWHWIPTRTWGPAWVHWYSGSDYYGWSPLSYYNYPGVILNNRYYGRHSNGYYPANSRALVMVHKNQLHARHISKVALSHNQAGRLGRISLNSNQPKVRAVANRGGVDNARAVSVLSRSKIRQVNKSFSSGAIGKTAVRKSPASSTNISRISRKGAVSASGSSAGSNRVAGKSTESLRTVRKPPGDTAGKTSTRTGIKSYSPRGTTLSRTTSRSSKASGISSARRTGTATSTRISGKKASSLNIKTYNSRTAVSSPARSRIEPSSRNARSQDNASVRSGKVDRSAVPGYSSRSSVRAKTGSGLRPDTNSRSTPRASSSSRIARRSTPTISSSASSNARSRISSRRVSPAPRSSSTKPRTSPTYRAPSSRQAGSGRAVSAPRSTPRPPKISSSRARASSSGRASGASKARASRSSAGKSSGKVRKK